MSFSVPVSRLDDTYIQLKDDGEAIRHHGGAPFWQQLFAGELPDIDVGRLVMAGASDSDWPRWEMHPNGDELVMLLEGDATLVVESPDGSERTDVRLDAAGAFVMVPRGCWHRLLVHSPCRTLLITPGAGTTHRDA